MKAEELISKVNGLHQDIKNFLSAQAKEFPNLYEKLENLKQKIANSNMNYEFKIREEIINKIRPDVNKLGESFVPTGSIFDIHDSWYCYSLIKQDQEYCTFTYRLKLCSCYPDDKIPHTTIEATMYKEYVGITPITTGYVYLFFDDKDNIKIQLKDSNFNNINIDDTNVAMVLKAVELIDENFTKLLDMYDLAIIDQLEKIVKNSGAK